MTSNTLKLAAAALAVAAFTANAAFAADAGPIPGEFSANVALTNDYMYRGISQNDEGPAIQGGFDYAYEFFSAGVWASPVDFNDGDEANIEIDYYASIGSDYKGISWSVGGIYYSYPGSRDNLNYDFFEANAGLGYDFGIASADVSFNYSPEFFGDSGDATYVTLGVAVPLSNDFTLSGAVGRQWIDKEAVYGVPDYVDWKIALGTTFKGIDLEIAYVDTDLSKRECADNCDARAILTVSKSF
jgi:uncharacterized protein (TIGR02001 family)